MKGLFVREIMRVENMISLSINTQKKELGQYPAILSSRLVNNPYIYIYKLSARFTRPCEARDQTEHDTIGNLSISISYQTIGDLVSKETVCCVAGKVKQ